MACSTLEENDDMISKRKTVGELTFCATDPSSLVVCWDVKVEDDRKKKGFDTVSIVLHTLHESIFWYPQLSQSKQIQSVQWPPKNTTIGEIYVIDSPSKFWHKQSAFWKSNNFQIMVGRVTGTYLLSSPISTCFRKRTCHTIWNLLLLPCWRNSTRAKLFWTKLCNIFQKIFVSALAHSIVSYRTSYHSRVE